MDRDSMTLEVLEYLPQQGAHVDLLQPYVMSQVQLLELFERRGFSCLVSKHDPLHRLVDLYYDYIMPMPKRDIEQTTIVSSSLAVSPSLKSATLNTPPPPAAHKLPVYESHRLGKKRGADVRLEDIVIVNDPKRITSGANFTIPQSNEERTLSVRYPEQTRFSQDSSNTNSKLPCGNVSSKNPSKNIINVQQPLTVTDLHTKLSLPTISVRHRPITNTATPTVQQQCLPNRDAALGFVHGTKRTKLKRDFNGI